VPDFADDSSSELERKARALKFMALFETVTYLLLFDFWVVSPNDAVKAVDPKITVIGFGLSPRGNDNPRASSNISTSPVRFIRDLGAAYRASGRLRPIMDEPAFHPYPNPSSANDPLSKGYQWPNAGVPNLDRIKQAFWDAFNGTAQPTFAEAGGARSLAALVPPPTDLVLDETGWQTSIPAESRTAYTGVENSKTVSEATQARIYGDLIRLVACDPDVASLMGDCGTGFGFANGSVGPLPGGGARRRTGPGARSSGWSCGDGGGDAQHVGHGDDRPR